MSRKSKKKKKANSDRLQEIYDSLPTIECKGLCHETCGMIPMTSREFDNLVKLRAKPFPEESVTRPARRRVVLTTPALKCPALVLRKCSVHEARPMICRLFGVVDDWKMKCPHGCQPSRWLKNDDVMSLMAEVEKLK